MKGKTNMKRTIKNNNKEWAKNILKVYTLDDTLEKPNTDIDEDVLEAREVAERHLKMKKFSTLKKEYPLEKVKFRPDGRCYVYIQRKQFIAPTYDLLIEKLYDEFYGVKNYTLLDLFPEWQIYRRDSERVSSRTLKDHDGYWRNYMQDSELVKIPITQIRPRDIKTFYRTVLAKNDISEGTFKFFRTILNKMFEGWMVLKTTVSEQQYDIPREHGISELKTSVVTFVARKEGKQ